MDTRALVIIALSIIAGLQAILGLSSLTSKAIPYVQQYMRALNDTTYTATPAAKADNQNNPPDLSFVNSITRTAPPLAKTNELVWGVGNAPIRIVEYVDYSDFFSFAQASKYDPKIVDALAPSGKVHYELRFLVSENDETTQRVIHAVLCATEQSRGWEMHYTIMANWYPIPHYYEGAYSEERLVKMAGTIDGLDIDRFKSCLASKPHKHVLQVHRYVSTEEAGKTHPFLVINGKRFMAPIELSDMVEIFREVAPEVELSNLSKE